MEISNVVQRQQRNNGRDTCMAEERGEVRVWRIEQEGHCVLQEGESWEQVEDGSDRAISQRESCEEKEKFLCKDVWDETKIDISRDST